MRLERGLLIVLLAIAEIVRAGTCAGPHCIFIPVISSEHPPAPSPSGAPVPSTGPTPSEAPTPAPSNGPAPSDAPVPSATPAPPTAPIARWSEGTPSPIVRSEAEGVAVGDKLYVFGGYSYPLDGWSPYSRVDVYDVGDDEWVRLRNLPQPVNHSGVATDGSFVYFAGGYVANAERSGAIYGSRDVFRYDIAADSYTFLPSLPLTRAAGALVLLGRTLHYFGGTNKERTVDTGDHWALDLDDIAAGWQTRAPLPNPRNHLGAVELNGQIYAVGGQHDHDMELVTQRDVHRYDPATDTWTAVAPMPAAVIDGRNYGRAHISASTFVRDGKVVVAGGEYSHTNPLREVIEYNPQTDRWTKQLPLPETRSSGVARQIGDKLIYATGGTESGRLTDSTLIGLP